jgi:putative CocE/NonD family hydrolase
MKTGCKRSIVLLATALMVALLACLAALLLATHKAAQLQSVYVEMSDSTQIAVDVLLPSNLKPGQRLPTVLRGVRYWRSFEYTPVGSLLSSFADNALTEEEDPENWSRAGYALVVVDVRGSGASFGQWSSLWSDREIADLGEVVDWIVEQPWSNGSVGAYGISYEGNTAELLARLNHPAIKAVAPQYSDVDVYAHTVAPGGVFNQWFAQSWDNFTRRLDADDMCVFVEGTGTTCEQAQFLFTGVKRVDADTDGAQLAAAIAGRSDANAYEAAQAIEYRDDEWGSTGRTIDDMGSSSDKEAIEKSNVPMYVWVSWIDSASVEGALERYREFSNPQKLIIGPWCHGGGCHVDPFLPADTPTDPSEEEQFEMLAAFFDAYLKDDAGQAPTFDITYYTLGEGKWKTTEVWPPEGFTPQHWYFAPNGALATSFPTDETGADEYTVDWTTTTGDATRWHTGLMRTDVVYPDRADEDEKLLTYTSAPMETDVEITGNPVITLYVASTETDGAFHVYLEDVAPDDRVTYITEGIMRTIHRAESGARPEPHHTFERADAAPMVPGEVTEIRFNLYATSVLIEKGHRIRIAIAGHDASVFARYPAAGTPVLTVQRNSVCPSHVELPMKVR